MGRFAIYLISVVGFGLVQLWTLAAILYFKGVKFGMADLAKDGGLFFFAISLSAVSVFILTERRRSGYTDIIITALVLSVVLLISIVGYSVQVSQSMALGTIPRFDGRYALAQYICAVLAIVYGIFVQGRTSSFSPNNPQPQPHWVKWR